MRGARACLWLAIALMLGGCGQNPVSTSTTVVATPGAPTVAPVATPQAPAVAPLASAVPGVNLGPDEQQAVAAAMQDAATHLGVAASELSVQQVEAREWGDSSLGCPQPGNLYSQIVTPGFVIVINSRGKQLEYHSDTRARVVLCRES
jgi:hypothetical protein